MKTLRLMGVAATAMGAVLMAGRHGHAQFPPPQPQSQCCLSGLFAGCCKKPPAYAVAPVMAPMVAPVPAPIPAPPPPVMVPVQQTSYVPETTYRTQYQSVPVTTYKPSCEIDPCTGCPRECMQPVTQYVQQAVNVPVTQYRAVTTTKYVQMQPGYAAAGGYAAPGGYPAAVAPAPAATVPSASPFAAPLQTTPQGWGAAGPDVPATVIPPAAQPAMPAAGAPPSTFQQPITPQSATTYATPGPAQNTLQPTQPPVLGATPSLRPAVPPATEAPQLKPIPELPRTPPVGSDPAAATASPATSAPQLAPQAAPAAPQTSGSNAVPATPGTSPNAASGSFPRLLEPTGHTTSWQPATDVLSRVTPAYPTAVLPSRLPR
jgi:hypothetical protein